MSSEPVELSPREQTDESLRSEREKADHALGADLSAIDVAADDVINRARDRADELLAAARAKIDLQAHGAPGALPRTIIRERAVEDQVLREERAIADDVLRDERAAHVAILATERNETDKDLSTERARSDDALARRDEFLAVVSHDLRALLNTITGSAGMIVTAVAEAHGAEPILKHAERIRRSGGRMGRLIGDLIDVASIEAGTLAVTMQIGDPALIVHEALEIFQAHAAGSNVSLSSEVSLPLPPVTFDSARLLQVLTNLLSNALKFTAPGGTIVVRLKRLDDDLLFAVSDTGMGIPADKLDAVFTRFMQLNPSDRRGVGLGLFISKCIVQGHGGRIWVESSVGDGTTFSFTLPASQTDPAGSPPPV